MLLELYDFCEAGEVAPQQSVLDDLIIASGALVSELASVDHMKQVLSRLYSERYSAEFSDSSLTLALQQIQVMNNFAIRSDLTDL